MNRSAKRATRRKGDNDNAAINDLLQEKMATDPAYRDYPRITERLSDSRTEKIDYLYQGLFVEKEEERVQEMIMAMKARGGREGNIWHGLLWKKRGNVLFKERKYEEARDAYMKAIRYTLGKDDSYSLPHRNAAIPVPSDASERQYADALGSAGNIAQSYINEEKVFEVSYT